MANQIDPVALVKLRDMMTQAFSFDELTLLVADSGVNPEQIPGRDSGRNRYVHELIIYFDRRGRLDQLLDAAASARPMFDWGSLLSKDKTPTQTSGKSIQFLAEAKLILVGDGNVGKTSLVNRLIDDSFDAQETTTRGIAMRNWQLGVPREDVKSVRLNIWDFGGQGNMHATHPTSSAVARFIYWCSMSARMIAQTASNTGCA